MLLLLTIGLVLVATVALVIGFATSALAPIYVSIACSVLAALVLFLFSRLSKREAPVVAGGPAPLPGPTVASAPSPASSVTVLDTPPDESEITAPVATVEPMPVDVTRGEEAFAPENVSPTIEADAAIAAGDVPSWQRHAAETEEAEEGAEAGEAEEGAEPERADEVEPETVGGVPASAAAYAASSADEAEAPEQEPALAAAGIGTAGDEDEELIFPIADYDELRVGEIVPLLPELDRDELEMVREREEQGRARTGVLRRIDQLLPVAPPPPGEVAGAGALAAGADDGSEREEASAPPQVDEALPALAETPVAPEGVAAGATAPSEGAGAAVSESDVSANAGDVAEAVPAAAASRFPIDDYENRKVTEILPLLNGLTADELAQVAERERAGKGRGTVLSKVEQLLASPPAPPAPPKKAPAKAAGGTTKAAAKKTGAAAKTTKAPAQTTPAQATPAQATPAEAPPAKATPAKKATKSTKK